jgi:hypothetical protein
VETNKSKQNDWWAAFEKLRVKYQRRKIAFRFYTRNLYQKVFVGFLKQRFMTSVYDHDKLKEASRKDYMSMPMTSQPQSKVVTTRNNNERGSDKNKIESSYRSENNRSDTLLHRTLLSFTPPKNYITDLTRSNSKDLSRDPEKSRSTKKDLVNSNAKTIQASKSPSPTTQRKTPTSQSNHKALKIKTSNENSSKSFKEQKPPAGLSKNASKKTIIIGVKSPTEPAITPKQTPLNFEKSPTIQLNTSASKSPMTADGKENSFTPVLGRTVAMVNEFSEHTTRKNPKQTLEMNIDASKSFESFARKETSTQVENIFTTNEDPNLTHITNNFKTDSGKKDYSRFFSEFSMKNINTTEAKAFTTEPSFTRDDISCFDKTYFDPEKEEV